MASGSHRLDRFISRHLRINRRDVKSLLARECVTVDAAVARGADQLVNQFSRIVVDGQPLPNMTAVYLQLHKPVGFLSATRDDRHQTVLQLIDHPARQDLHIVGRLDRHSSGLLLLSNDGLWSQALMAPERKVSKVYEVRVRDPLTQAMIDAFAAGMHFSFEDITTRPAKLEILAPCLARITLIEGRYHQIKRMFGRFRNPVLSLHRIAIGGVALDPSLVAGQWRELSPAETVAIHSAY